MKITKEIQIADLLAAVENCKHDVWLTSIYGDKFNLRSAISRYLAIGALLSEHGDELELWCDSKEDEVNFRKFFKEHPETLCE